MVGGPKENYAIVGHRGSGWGQATPFQILGPPPPCIPGMAEARGLKFHICTAADPIQKYIK